MRNRTFADLDRVVALGGGHGLGRVMSSLSSLGSRLTGIVTTTDNGGSTGGFHRADPSFGRWHCLGRYAQLHQSVNCRAERSVGDV